MYVFLNLIYYYIVIIYRRHFKIYRWNDMWSYDRCFKWKAKRRVCILYASKNRF